MVAYGTNWAIFIRIINIVKKHLDLEHLCGNKKNNSQYLQLSFQEKLSLFKFLFLNEWERAKGMLFILRNNLTLKKRVGGWEVRTVLVVEGIFFSNFEFATSLPREYGIFDVSIVYD